MKKIIISKPYIKEEKNSKIFGHSVKLCALITMENPNTNKRETKECYFEFEKRYKKYLCENRSDAFVMGLLSSAMENGMDIEFEAPISERLYYQLTNYYIPMIAKYNRSYPMNNIKLIGPYESKIIPSENAVVTGCSGGVDSFYTIAKYTKTNINKKFKLTHLIYNSMGIVSNNEEKIGSVFKNTSIEMQKIADECNLDLISCYNNLYEFYLVPFKSFVTFFTTTYGALGFALQKLIGIYYVNSGDPISEFNLDLKKTHGYDCSIFDIFTLSYMNTENLQFYSTGIECGRIEKENYIADFKPAQKYLSVCGFNIMHDDSKNNTENCCQCYKCLRTMSQFYSLGKLNNFKQVFTVNQFMQNKSKYIGKMIGQDKHCYIEEMQKIALENNVKIPKGAYLYAYLWYKPIKFLRKTFKNSLLARKIYYKLNLDYKLDGYRGQNYEVYKDKITKTRK